jgi:L-amino acid N-acyltransferase YncA
MEPELNRPPEDHVVIAGLVDDVALLEQILQLQHDNLPANLSPTEARAQGFVTLEHSLDALRRMHAMLPSVVARENGRLVGYALAMARECRAVVPVLEPMFQVLDSLQRDGGPLARRRYYVMGQVCVEKASRGRGVLEALYAAHRDAYASRFDELVTEISVRNTRSLKAHARVGFRDIHRYQDATDSWVVVAWDWRQPVLPAHAVVS